MYFCCMLHISDNFTYHELVKTSHKELFLKNALRGVSLLPECFYLCDFLESLRQFLGRPVVVNSGYRCNALNTLVGGASSSDHMHFCAVDIKVTSDEVLELHKWLLHYDNVRYFKYYNSGYYHISLKRLTPDEHRFYSTYYDDSFLLSLYEEITSYT